MGALALTLAGSGSAMVEQVVGTVIAPLQGGTAGANWYNLRPDSGPIGRRLWIFSLVVISGNHQRLAISKISALLRILAIGSGAMRTVMASRTPAKLGLVGCC